TSALHRVGGAMGDAGRGGVDQPRDAVLLAGFKHVPGTHHVGLVVLAIRPPGAGLGRIVEDRVAALRRGEQRVAVGQVAAHLGHAHRGQRRVLAAIEAHHLMAAFAQATTQRLPQEPAATGDQDLQVDSSSLRAAQDASCSRPSFALWRMSTGAPGRRIPRSMPLVCGCVAPSARSSPATIGQSFSGTPGLSSTHSTGCFAPATPTPTSAVRRTLGWVLNTGSTCSVYSG